MSEQPTAEELAMNLGAHLDSLKEYFSGKLPEGSRATPIREFYHVAGHVAAIRRALHAEEHIKKLEEALRSLIECFPEAAFLNPTTPNAKALAAARAVLNS